VNLREEYLKHVKYISFSDQNICIIFPYYQLIFSIRSKVIGIETTLRAGRFGHLVLVRKRYPFHLQNMNVAIWDHKASLKIGGQGPFLT